MLKSGILITFEGSEGCGKSTQIGFLAQELEKKFPAQEILVLREPGGTPLGEKIRYLLQHAEESANMSPEAELLLFAASRAQLVREIIEPALARNALILCDRFFDSTTVYQGVARALSQEVVAIINEIASGKVTPHLTFLLDLETEVGRARMKERNKNKMVLDRMEQEPEDFYEQVRQGYLELAKKEPGRWAIIDASLSIEEVSQKIRKQFQNRFNILL